MTLIYNDTMARYSRPALWQPASCRGAVLKTTRTPLPVARCRAVRVGCVFAQRRPCQSPDPSWDKV
eukprot:364787-Chlamydomonas_euryale.AAC.14